ncbi:MAG: hypothetical protein KatS3mg105_1045 [Gemmatales bacterium]|nr:MAG: hypothetical protein KatS3mg105_1045 [Gemmatales bacterium]
MNLTNDLWSEKRFAEILNFLFRCLVKQYSNPELADSLASTAVAKLWEKERKNPDFFQTFEHARNYARKIAYNEAISQSRKEQRLDKVHRQYAKNRDTYLKGATVRQEICEFAHDCLASLPEEDRFILDTYYLSNQSDADIGCAIFSDHTSKAAKGQRARRLRMRSLERCKQLLLKHGFDPQILNKSR